MEYEKLKLMWDKYDSKLDRLENLNKRLLFQSLSKKPRFKLFYLKYKNIQSVILYPIALTLLLSGYYHQENLGWKLIVGSVFTLAVLIYLIYINLKTFNAYNALDLSHDSVVDAAKKSNKIKNIFKIRYRNALVTLPLLYWGIVLIAWNSITFNALNTSFIVGLFSLLFIYNLKGTVFHKNIINKFEKDILELREFME